MIVNRETKELLTKGIDFLDQNDQIHEAIPILQEVVQILHRDQQQHTTNNDSVDYRYVDYMDAINFRSELVRALDYCVDKTAFTFDNDDNDEIMNDDSTTIDKHCIENMLNSIALLQENIVLLMKAQFDLLAGDDGEEEANDNQQNGNKKKKNKHDKFSFTNDLEMLADACLDWAVACKRANLIGKCIEAHRMRMSIFPRLQKTDAVRLLGISSNFDNKTYSLNDDSSQTVQVDEYISNGIFKGQTDTTGSYRPTPDALLLGYSVKTIFTDAEYTASNCHDFMIKILKHQHQHEFKHTNKIPSANFFFYHRHELYDYISLDADNSNAAMVTLDKKLQVLISLFLCGLALDYQYVSLVLGQDDLQTLFNAKILRVSPANEKDVVAEVQVYPLSLHAFEPDGNTLDTEYTDDVFLCMTDWNLESLTMPRTAVMTVGYDTLELLSLSSGLRYNEFHKSKFNSGRILDLCCGCGIQGLYTVACTKSNITNHTTYEFSELVLMDINLRACYFTLGNISLNGLLPIRSQRKRIDIRVLQSDIFQPFTSSGNHDKIEISPIGKFDYILCNPPFVSVPLSRNIPSLSPALFSAGGGRTGLNILQRILGSFFQHLTDMEASSLFVMTELPNVETSCELVKSLLPNQLAEQARIRISYISDDVETVDEYAMERENESGMNLNDRGWLEEISSNGIRNRALVLMSISRNRGDDLMQISSFTSDMIQYSDDDNERDLFLTPEGVKFSRSTIL